MAHPSTTPLEQWPPAWLKLEVASLCGEVTYIMMYDHEKVAKSLPVTEDEMRRYIKAHRNGNSASAN